MSYTIADVLRISGLPDGSPRVQTHHCHRSGQALGQSLAPRTRRLQDVSPLRDSAVNLAAISLCEAERCNSTPARLPADYFYTTLSRQTG